jgi:hypothetical protein
MPTIIRVCALLGSKVRIEPKVGFNTSTECPCGYTCGQCGIVTNNPPEAARTYESAWENSAPGTGWARSMLDSEAGWNYRDGAYPPEWMQIDLGSTFQVYGVVTQCRANFPHCPYEIEVQYSLTASNFVSATAVGGTTRFFLPTTYSSTAKTSSVFSQPVVARYIRIVMHNGEAMRAGVLTSSASPSSALSCECRSCINCTIDATCDLGLAPSWYLYGQKNSCPATKGVAVHGSTTAGDCVCLPGSYSQANGSSPCLPCPPGTFADKHNTSQCTPCPANSWHDKTNQTNISVCLCNAGWVGIAANGCVECAAGTYETAPGTSILDLSEFRVQGQELCGLVL